MTQATHTNPISRVQLHYYYKVLYGAYGGPQGTAWVRKTKRKTKRGG